ncbi:MAG: LON peptidase substrate-binding domain-containing protein, partial [Desulfobacterales bacterium]
MTQPQSSNEIKTDKLPEILPILPMIDAVLFPKMVLPLLVIQERSIQLVDEAMSQNRIIGLVVAKKPIQEGKYTKEDLHEVGTSALILKMAKTEDNKLQLLTQGMERFRIKDFIKGKPYPRARVQYMMDDDKKDKETEALMSNMISQFARIAELSPGLPPEIVSMAKSLQNPGILADMIAST